VRTSEEPRNGASAFFAANGVAEGPGRTGRAAGGRVWGGGFYGLMFIFFMAADRPSMRLRPNSNACPAWYFLLPLYRGTWVRGRWYHFLYGPNYARNATASAGPANPIGRPNRIFKAQKKPALADRTTAPIKRSRKLVINLKGRGGKSSGSKCGRTLGPATPDELME